MDNRVSEGDARRVREETKVKGRIGGASWS